MRNLYLAYAVTWVILGIYFILLWRRHQRLKAEQSAMRK